MVRRFLSRGAFAYFPKSGEMGELVGAVRDAAAGGPPSPGGADDAVRAPGDAPENLPEATRGGREGW
jgi:DNA-binding NarL/FixJ family response regulator